MTLQQLQEEKLDCYFIGGESDGRYMPFRYLPVIRIPKEVEITFANKEEAMSTPNMEVEEYKVAAISVDKKQAIYTLSGTLDELIRPAKLLKGIRL